jgi:Icc-related predicted phosphoesterase
MRIYAVADIHGKAGRLDRIGKLVKTLAPDVLVTAGDITHFLRSGRVMARLDQIGVPVLAVRGNTDRAVVERMFHQLANISPLHMTPTERVGTPFIGVSGTVLLPFRSQIRYRESALFRQLERVLDKRSVLVVHPPPLGIRDCVLGRFHAGSRRVRLVVERRQPALVICGHIHENPGWERVGRSVVVNCTMGRNGGGAVIDTVGSRVDAVKML